MATAYGMEIVYASEHLVHVVIVTVHTAVNRSHL